MTPEEAILRWAVLPANTGETPDTAGIDADELLRLVVRHRIVGRFRARLETETPPRLPRLFLTRLRFVEHQQRALFRDQLVYAVSLAARYGTPEHPLIFLKGFGAYAVTSDEERKRPVGDFDVIAHNPPEVFDALLADGFHGKRHYTHEYGKFSDSKATVDLHEYFPVRGYPTQGWNTDTVTALPQVFTRYALPELPPDYEESAIRYDDLLAHSQRGIAPGTQPLTFPTPEMTCLMLCAHAFRDAIMRLHYIGKDLHLLLGELADADAIAGSPGFNAALFTALVSRFGGTDSVTWVARQCERFFGNTALPQNTADAVRTLHTIEHLSMGGWMYVEEPGPSPRSGESVLARLGCQALTLPRSGTINVPFLPVLFRDTVPVLRLQAEQDTNRIIFTVNTDSSLTEFRLSFLQRRYILCRYTDGVLYDHRFKNLADPTFLTPDGDPHHDAATNRTRVTFIVPNTLAVLSCFLEWRTETASAYAPFRLHFAGATTDVARRSKSR